VEARWALADWNKIPLNPTIFAEYKFGVGDLLHDERVAQGEQMAGPAAALAALRLQKLSRARAGASLTRSQEDNGGGRDPEFVPHPLPDAFEARLLLAQDFGERVEWALNGFFEQETSGDRGREWGFAQSIVTPLTRNEYLKAGVEMLYRNFTDKDTRDDPQHSFVIGPTIAWKPNRWSRVDVSPLFGVTDVSPHAEVFVVFSMLLGGGGEQEAEAPASTRNR
jgi:hypothetical protein